VTERNGEMEVETDWIFFNVVSRTQDPIKFIPQKNIERRKNRTFMAESEQVLRVRKINRSRPDTGLHPHTVMIFEKMVDAVAVQYSSRRYLEEGS
jgi:hypothetical protein